MKYVWLKVEALYQSERLGEITRKVPFTSAGLPTTAVSGLYLYLRAEILMKQFCK